MPPALSAVVLPDLTPDAFVATVVEAEAAGLRTAWTYDHLSWRDMREGPWFAALPLLTAAAAATSTIRLGPLVASPNFRHPVPFAAEVQTIDHLSGGRVELGVGAGTSAEDAHVLGVPPLTPRERQDRFEEWTTLLTTLLAQRATTASGAFYTAQDARTVPGPVQDGVPLVVGAEGPRGMRFAARTAHTWVTTGARDGHTAPAARFEAVRAQVAPERTVRRQALLGRDEAGAFEDYPGFLAGLEAAGFDEVTIHWPRPDGWGVPAGALAGVLAAHGLG